MNTDNYNNAIEQLVLYRRKAILAKPGTPERKSYVSKLDSGYSILAIVYDKCLETVYRDVCEAYASKYRQ